MASLSRRLIYLTAGTAAAVALGELATALWLTRSGFLDEAQRTTEIGMRVLDRQLEDRAARHREVALALAHAPAIAEALRIGDAARLEAAAREVVRNGRAEMVWFADADGAWVTGGGSDGELPSPAGAKSGANGQASAGLEAGGEVELALRAVEPVRRDGAITGAVLVGEPIAYDHDLVDWTSDATGMATTVFLDDLRVTTTIVQEGKRAVGTRMTNPEVLRRVVRDGEVFFDQNTILGVDYVTSYWPMRDFEGDTIGMLFVGKELSEIQAATAATTRTTLLVGALLLLVAAAIGVVLARGIVHPILEAVEFADELAAGRLDAQISTSRKDEIGRLTEALAEMGRRLGDAIRRVRGVAQGVTEDSRAVSEASTALRRDSQEQAASVEEVSASIEQMLAGIQSNSHSAQRTETIVEQAASDAEASHEQLERSTNALAEISQRVALVREIARQTDMLALNAAIEAARAGTHGKGFAVVATEVRRLAERSGTAAREITELAETSVREARAAQGSLAEMVPQVRQSADLVREVSAASREQATGAEQIQSAVESLSRGIEGTSRNAEDGARIAHQLEHGASELESSVAYFQTDQRTSAPGLATGANIGFEGWVESEPTSPRSKPALPPPTADSVRPSA